MTGRRTPLYDLARKLEERGYGDWKLQAYTPEGTPSLRGPVKVMAGLAVSESDKDGLRLRKYQPFPPGGRPKDGDERVSGAQGAGKGRSGLCGLDSRNR